MSRKQRKTALPRQRKPAVERFVSRYRDGVEPQKLTLPTGVHRGRQLGQLTDDQLNSVYCGYRSCGWADVVAVIDYERHRRAMPDNGANLPQ